MTGFAINSYIEHLEDRIGMLKEIIKMKDRKIEAIEANINADPATSRMVLVPEEPDEKMLEAARKVLISIRDLEQTPFSEISKKVWKAMVDAAHE